MKAFCFLSGPGFVRVVEVVRASLALNIHNLVTALDEIHRHTASDLTAFRTPDGVCVVPLVLPFIGFIHSVLPRGQWSRSPRVPRQVPLPVPPVSVRAASPRVTADPTVLLPGAKFPIEKSHVKRDREDDFDRLLVASAVDRLDREHAGVAWVQRTGHGGAPRNVRCQLQST